MKHPFSIDLQNRVHRRYIAELGLALLLYFFALLAAQWLGGRVRTGLLLDAIALLPMAPIGLAAFAIFRYLTDCDEFERHVQLSSLAITVCITAFASLAYGFLEGAGLPRLSMFTVWPFMGAAWFVSSFLLRMRYR